MDNALVKSINSRYSKKLLEYNNFEIINTFGQLHQVNGFDKYNQLININSLFSNFPKHEPVDRTETCLGPIRHTVDRVWTIPAQELSLETALQRRVDNICRLYSKQKINLFWSGGIDSTCFVVAFLQYATDLSQFRVLFSPWSIYEHPDFFKLLQSRSIETVDISGDNYFNLDLDGVYISGNPGDELHGSLDQSFFDANGYDFLHSSWKDFFYRQLPDTKFIDFCEEYFLASGKNISTILEARWWFYISSKLVGLINQRTLPLLTAEHDCFDPKRLLGFFDCDEYEGFVYFNVDKLITSRSYSSWRQFLKDFCYRYDKNDHWRINKTKFNSAQLVIYQHKKQFLNNSRNLMILENGHQVATQNLPFFSRQEWDEIKHKYQYVFRTPNSV